LEKIVKSHQLILFLAALTTYLFGTTVLGRRRRRPARRCGGGDGTRQPCYKGTWWEHCALARLHLYFSIFVYASGSLGKYLSKAPSNKVLLSVSVFLSFTLCRHLRLISTSECGGDCGGVLAAAKEAKVRSF
jgi:hypothetical protein